MIREREMEQYRISVIVPVYNAEKYLAECVDSLLAQDYPCKEIILVDDGSKDAGGRMCDEYAAAHPDTVRVIHKENGGLVSAWTCGLKAAQGKYLCFVDSDDWADACMLSDLGRHLTGSDAEIISSDYVIEDSGSSRFVYQALAPGEYDRQKLLHEVIPHILGDERRPVHISRCMKLIARELLEKNLRYADERIRMGEDLNVMFPTLLDTQRLYVADHKAYYHYRYVYESMIHNYDPGMMDNIALLFGNLRKTAAEKAASWPEDEAAAFAGQEPEKVLNDEIDREYILSLLLALKNEARGNPSGYRKNIKKIAASSPAAEMIRTVPVTVSDKANRLLYHTLKHPDILSVSLLRLAMKVFYMSRK